MKRKIISKKMILSNALISLILILMVTLICFAFSKVEFTYAAKEQDEALIDDENLSDTLTEEPVDNNIMLLNKGGRTNDAILISGKNNYVDPFTTYPISDFTDVNYIANATQICRLGIEQWRVYLL